STEGRRGSETTVESAVEGRTRAGGHCPAIGAIAAQRIGSPGAQAKRRRLRRITHRERPWNGRTDRSPVVQSPWGEVEREVGNLVSAERGAVGPFIAQRDVAAVPGPPPQLRGLIVFLALLQRSAQLC